MDKFLIAPLETGMDRSLKPWLLPQDAFETLKNAYVYRGRLRKRFGSISAGITLDFSTLTCRLRVNLGNTDGAGNISGTVPGAIFKVGQQFSIGSEIFTVTTVGLQPMLTTGSATTRTYNTATGAYDIQGAAATTACYFYPLEPVMGFTLYESDAINDEPTFAFDTQFAYQFITTEWVRLSAGGAAAIWTGSNSEFFWSSTYRGATADINILFTSNYNATDGLRYWDGTTWTSWNPDTRGTGVDFIKTARIVIPFQNRLVLLNTKELVSGADKTFVNRCRYSQNGSPLENDAYYEKTAKAGKGGFLDAPTKEAIVSATTIKNRLIVYFERSTYELVYTNIEDEPFIWQEINNQLGSESTFSVVPFDKSVLAVGDVGIHACNGANVDRIDAKIPDEVFEFHNDDGGPLRVHGIRDYESEMVYWSIPEDAYYTSFPNRVLAYNYRNNSWAFFDDSITAFGYTYVTEDAFWINSEVEWQNTIGQWNSGVFETKNRTVIAGNQHGYTFLISRDWPINAQSLSVNNISESSGVITITALNHNLKPGDWIRIEDAQGITELNGNNYKVEVIDSDNITIDLAPVVTGTYSGGGTIALVSVIDVLTKRYSFYVGGGRNLYISKVDFYVDRTADDGEITIDAYPSASTMSTRDYGLATGSILGTEILETTPFDENPLESEQVRFWHAVYFQAAGESVQLRIYWSDEQMADENIPVKDFQMHGMLFHAMPTQEL